MFRISEVDAQVNIRVPRPRQTDRDHESVIGRLVLGQNGDVFITFNDAGTARDLMRAGRFDELDSVELKFVSRQTDKGTDVSE